MENEKSVANELPNPIHFIARPITQDRATEICEKLGSSFSEDERVDLLMELVMGLCADEEGLKEAGCRESDVCHYHDALAFTCAVELFRHTRQGWNSACQHLLDIGVVWEWKNGKVVRNA